MSKFKLLTIAFSTLSTLLLAQENANNIYVNDKGDIFVKADAPVYFFISPENQPTQKVLIPSTDKAANPMYLDGDGKHYLVYESKGEKVRYLIWADGIGPKSSLLVTGGLLFYHNNRVYVEEKAVFAPSATDSKSGVKQSFMSVDNLPFVPVKENIEIKRTGEYTIRIYSTDNVGNIGDTTLYKIVAAPDITFKVDNIYFETASARITNSSIENLKEMLEILKNYPELHVEIKAHADSRGSSDYNFELSQKRAQSVVNYLSSKGIDTNRLKAKGYGDTQPVNECVKGVKCPDSKLRENRRVEFRFYLPKK
jgi:outer membrane protein OmpA-like peptidoglycan-associated protein